MSIHSGKGASAPPARSCRSDDGTVWWPGHLFFQTFTLWHGGNILSRTVLGRFTVGLLSLHLLVLGAAGALRQEEGAFDSLEKALREPGKVRRLAIQGGEDPEMKHLPPGLGRLVNLEALEISCLEKLEDLPEEIGQLQKLEELVIDNGNGCSMNVSLPRSVGRLASLRVLRLYGALDGRDVGAAGPARNKVLPDELAELQRLEE